MKAHGQVLTNRSIYYCFFTPSQLPRTFTKTARSQSVSQLGRQAGKQAVSQAVSQSISQSVRKSVRQAGSQPVQSVRQTVTRHSQEATDLIRGTGGESVNQSVSQSVRQAGSQSVTPHSRKVSDLTREAGGNQSGNQLGRQSVSQAISQSVSQSVSQRKQSLRQSHLIQEGAGFGEGGGLPGVELFQAVDAIVQTPELGLLKAGHLHLPVQLRLQGSQHVEHVLDLAQAGVRGLEPAYTSACVGYTRNALFNILVTIL